MLRYPVGMADLTDKQKRFVEEYLIDLNATQAAIRAGYSEKTAADIGRQTLRKTPVAEAIRKALDARSEKTQIDAAWLLTRLAEEASADVADLYDEHGAIKPVKEWPKIWRQGLVNGMDIEQLTVDGASVGTVAKLRISDRVKRLELIGRHIGVQAFKDQIEHSGTVNLADRMAAGRRRALSDDGDDADDQ